MQSVLVTGGTGTLGRIVVQRLLGAGRDVRVLSRHTPPPSQRPPYGWVTGDLRRDEGLGEAVAGVDVIIHCASSARGDVQAARNLLEAARRVGSPHLVYISIVGVDRVPLGYYRSKLAVERLLEKSGVPWSVLRATQFHDLILRGCSAVARLPVMVVPADTSFQPIDAREVADRLVELATEGPAGRVPDMAGPQVRSARDLARCHLAASGRRRLVLPVRFPGAVAREYRRGSQLAPHRAVGRISFEEFLAERISSPRGPGS